MKKLLTIIGLSGLLTLLRILSGFVIAKLIAVYSGPSGVAMLGQLQGAIAVSSGVVNAPNGAGVVKFTAQNYNQGYKFCSPWWSAAVRLTLGLLLIVMPLLILGSESISGWLLGSEEYWWLFNLLAFAMPLAAMETLLTSVLNGQQEYKRFFLLGMLSVIISTIFIVIMVIGGGTTGALIALAINSALTGCVMTVGCLQQSWFSFELFFSKFQVQRFKDISVYFFMALVSAISLPMALVFIRSQLVGNLGLDIAGVWQSVWKISEVYLSVITVALATYYLPKLSRLNSKSEILNEIHTVLKVVIPFLLFSSMVVYFLRDWVVLLLFTSEFLQATSLFAVQLLGNVVKVVAYIYAFPLISLGALKWYVFNELFFSLLFVLLVVFLIPLFGVNGVVLAYLINYSLCLIFLIFAFDGYMRNE